MSHLEEAFALAWRTLGTRRARMVREYRFHPVRRWRFDFACPGRKVAVEIEGGTWDFGRHNRGDGFAKDCEKYNTAVLLGWTVLRYPGEALDRPGAVVAQVNEALARNRHAGLRKELWARHRTDLARELREGRDAAGSHRGGGRVQRDAGRNNAAAGLDGRRAMRRRKRKAA